MTISEKPIPAAPESTGLERRVIAHGRILQSFIAYMSKTEPRFIEHLKNRFVEPMKMSTHEHDYVDCDDYAEEFIRAIMLMDETKAGQNVGDRKPAAPAAAARVNREKAADCNSSPDRVQMKERAGIWCVTIDGKFWGHYNRKDEAVAAMAIANLSHC